MTRRFANLNIRKVLLELESQLRRGGRVPTDAEIARTAGISPATYSEFKQVDPTRRASPTAEQLVALARYFGVSLLLFLSEQPDLLVSERDGIRWRLRDATLRPRERALREAAEAVLRGEAPGQIAQMIAALRGSTGGLPGARLRPAAIAGLVRGALTLGLPQLEVSAEGEEIQDQELAAELSARFGSLPGTRRQVTVFVVRNVAHRDFSADPVAPFLIARLAQRGVASFLEDNPTTYTIGIAGGVHVAAFVRSIGAEGAPFPDAPGSDRNFTLVPLTLEPFREPHAELADTLVGDFHARTQSLLGARRATAHTFRTFGYLKERKVGSLETEGIIGVRQQYPALDVAIYGCGDQHEDGWLRRTLNDLSLQLDPPPATDVCLNPLSEQGTPIPLIDAEGRRELLGIALSQIGSLAAREDKLALLLTSGVSKGKPMTLVVRGGYANAVVCDQAAAREALRTLS